MKEDNLRASNENEIVENIQTRLLRIELNLSSTVDFINTKLVPKLDEIYYYLFPDRLERDKRLAEEFRVIDKMRAANPDASIEELFAAYDDSVKKSPDKTCE